MKEYVLKNRNNLIRKRNLSIAGMILAALIGLFSWNEFNEANKALLKLDETKLDEIYLNDDENTPAPAPTAQAY